VTIVFLASAVAKPHDWEHETQLFLRTRLWLLLLEGLLLRLQRLT
jgi:hypothetical protein